MLYFFFIFFWGSPGPQHCEAQCGELDSPASQQAGRRLYIDFCRGTWSSRLITWPVEKNCIKALYQTWEPDGS